MALVLADRVREGTNTAGTGTVTLTGAVTGFASFADQIGNGNTTYYTITDNTNWEVGVGTYNAGTLSRDTVLDSSTGALVNFAAGFKDVFVTLPGVKAVTTDTLATPPAIGGTTPAAGTFTTLTATGTAAFGTGSVAYWSAIGGSAPNLRSTAGGTIDIGGSNNLSIRTNTTAEQFRVSNTASAVNYVQVTGAATGAPSQPIISAQGSDANINIALQGKGTGSAVLLDSGGGSTLRAIPRATGGDTWVDVCRSVGGVSLQASSAVTNGALIFQSKGTGAIDLAAGSSGVNISNGGTVTAITRTAAGTAYTSAPSVAITAPTTAGGVQATASVSGYFPSTATVQAGGTGYTNGDVLTVVGGTGSSTYTVTAVSSGAVTAVSVTSGSYTVLPTNPVSTTGGTGSGCTLNLTFTINTIAVGTAGSGYVEQPTVSFSGGGGSGAAAYATVGSGTVVKSIGATMSFTTPGGEQFRVNDSGTSAVNYWQATGATASSFVNLLATGSDTNVTGALIAKGTGGLVFSTNGASSNSQMRITHTASAVNYVQVTGGATTIRPTISAQGSDINLGLGFTTKGTGRYAFFNNNALSSSQFSIGLSGLTTAVNYLNVNGAAAGSAPAMTAEGNDTNIDLTLTPKGTGVVQFGTYTAGILTPTGYITVKDSGGTTRRLLVG